MVTVTNEQRELTKPWVAGDTIRFPEAPDLPQILHLFRDYRDFYRMMHAGANKADDYYQNRNVIAKPESADEVRPGTARSIVDVATDHVDINNIAIDVPPPSPRGKARAERIKKFLQHFWMSLKTPVKRTGVHSANKDGIGFWKLMWATEMWPDAPDMESFGNPDVEEDFNLEGYRKALDDWSEKRKITFPFKLFNIQSTNLLWDDSRVGMKWVIEFHESTIGDVRRKYPEWTTLKSDDDITTWMEYWDDTWYAYIADNEWVVKPRKHGYGFMPYTQIIPARSGNFDTGRPQDRFQSILFPVYSLLDSEARLMTQYEAMVRKYAWKTLDFKGNRRAAEEVAEAYETWGAKNVIPDNVDVLVSPEVHVPQDILRLLDIVQTAIEEATFPNVVRGVRPRGVSAGFAISVLAGQGRLVFQGVADGIARAVEQVNTNVLKLIENKARGAVTVHARSEIHDFDQTIGPDDIRGLVENVAELTAEAPEEAERRSFLALRLKEGGIISTAEAMRRSGVTNPLEEQNQIATELILEQLRGEQALQVQQLLAQQEAGQLAEVAEPLQGGGQNIGNQFTPGQAQPQRVAERNIQQARVASQQGQESVFPQGMSGLDALARRIGAAGGPGIRVPSGQRVG